MQLVRTNISRHWAVPDGSPWNQLQYTLLQHSLDEADSVVGCLTIERATFVRGLFDSLYDYRPEGVEHNDIKFLGEQSRDNTRCTVYFEDSGYVVDRSGDGWTAPIGAYALLSLSFFTPASNDTAGTIYFIAVWFDKQNKRWRAVNESSDHPDLPPTATVIRWQREAGEKADTTKPPSLTEVIKATFEAPTIAEMR